MTRIKRKEGDETPKLRMNIENDDDDDDDRNGWMKAGLPELGAPPFFVPIKV